MSSESKVWTKTQLVVFFVTLLLTIDELNPVKIVLKNFSISPWQIATLCLALMAYIVVSDMKGLLYFSVKTFLHSILRYDIYVSLLGIIITPTPDPLTEFNYTLWVKSIFFRSVEIIGRENIPHHGPVIFTVNHANQFVDAAMVLCTCRRKVSYLMAEASWKRRIVGDIAWLLDVVPVKRAQDEANKGSGRIRFGQPSNGSITVTGEETKFTREISVGDKLRPPGTAFAVKVKSVESDSSLTLDPLGIPDGYPFPEKDPVKYDILSKVPLDVVFDKVLVRLASGGTVGIFPEGGSHDRTDLLPLKVGVALIAYSAMEKHGISVPIVPVGLSYFEAHRWRGRAVVEYGRPITLDPASLDDFKAGGEQRRQVCSWLLEEIETSMRSVIVATPDYETLETIHAARRLYQRKDGPLDTSMKQDLSRRFAEGYKRLLLMVDGNPPQEWLNLQTRIRDYHHELKDLGLKDYQVPALAGEHLEDALDVSHVDGDAVLSFLQLGYHIVHLLVLLAVAAFPVIFLNLPVGILAGMYSESRRKRALANSKVKIKAYDVMLTEKILFCLVMVPTLWLVYGLLLSTMTELDVPAIVLILLLMPLFAYLGIVVTEAGMVDWKDLRPYLVRLHPSARSRLAALPETRRILQQDLREFIRKIGPGLGELYYEKELDWKAILDASKQPSTEDEPKKEK